MNTKRFISFSTILLTTVSSVFSQCIIAGTGFDTEAELCCPVLTSDSQEDGWYNDKLNLAKLCKTTSIADLESAKQVGIGGVLNSYSNSNIKDIDNVFHLNTLEADGNPAQYGYSVITAQPKMIHPFCKANEESNNMLVNIGSALLCPILSYTVYGLDPGTTAELSFTLYDLLDATYFDFLVNEAKVTKLSEYITKYTYSNTGAINGNALDFGVVSSNDNIEFNTSYNNAIVPTGLKNATTAKVAYGEFKTVTHTAKVPENGNITFYFYRNSNCYQIPIGIDDIKVTGNVRPLISAKGNPCPMQPAIITSKQNYPEGTKFSWKETVTGQTSSNASFSFTPMDADADYSVTLEVTMPGCQKFKSEALNVHSGTCCTSAEGVPMAMTYLYYDDFGNFVADDIYEWTDRYGISHTEKIPAGQVHTSQSINDIKIPYVKAYYLENSGATLAVPLAGTDPNKTELFNHGVYVVSKNGGYPGGVPYDNSGTKTGGMLQFDLLDDGTQDDFFEIDIEHICTGKEVSFGVDFASISEFPGAIEVKLECNGKTITSKTASVSGGSDGWRNISETFAIKSEDVGGVSESTITMKISNTLTNADGFGRDYALDNIFFSVCTPPDVNVESSVSTGKDILDLCTEDVLTLTSVTSDAVKRFYLYSGNQIDPTKKVGYVYQYTFQDPSTESDKNPITWNTLHKEEVVETESFDVEVEKYWDDIFSKLENDPKHEKRIYFRVVVGEYSDLIADQSWKKNSAFSPCRKISISTIPVVAGLNCAACSHLDFEETGVTFTADNGKFDTKKKVVELCAGESVELGIKDAVHGLDKDGNDYNDYEVKWFMEDVNSTALASKKCKTGSDDVAPTIVVDYDDVEDAGATGVKYIISFHDYFDPASPTTSCDMTDTITVIANPKPDKTLDNPDPFCEGTLEKEPSKSISGYTIGWYEDADTLTTTDEPEIGSLTKADSPKSYYYVLTDETTGCRGDANEYLVEVNKAEANVVSNSQIDYKKVDAKNGSLKPLDKQKPSTFKSALSIKDHTLMVGLVEGATDATAPDLATAKFGAASSTIPTPTVKDVDSSDDEYLWYYTYLESAEGCVSDTVLVRVVFLGAPSPTSKDAAYCVNSGEVKPMSDYATPAAEDPNGTLKFYGTDKTTPMSATDLPDVTKPGKYTYWVSQESSTGGGESSKQPIVIEVYGVNDVELDEVSDKYCRNADDAKAVEKIAKVKSSTDQYVVNSGWEFFEANEPTLNEATAGAETSMPVKTTTAGEFKYYARLKYEVPNSAEVCYGKHVEYTAEIQSVADPITGTVTYLKAEGENGGFKKPTDQTPDAIIGDASCTDCSIVWFDVNKNEIDESDATPKYDASLIGSVSYTYYVKQVNALGCKSLFKPVTIIVDATPTSLTNTPAKAVSITPNPASTKISVIAEETVEKVEILNMVGEVVKVSNSKDIDTSNLSNGVYFVRTTVNDETTVHKLVINK